MNSYMRRNPSTPMFLSVVQNILKMVMVSKVFPTRLRSCDIRCSPTIAMGRQEA